MKHLQNTKTIPLYPRSIATNATASVTADCLGFASAMVIANLGIASSVATTLKLASGTASNSFTDIATFTGGTATSTSVGFVIPAADTDNGVPVCFHVDLAKRERFLKLQIENTSIAHVVSGEIILSRASIAPDTDAERGFDEVVIG